MSQLTAQGLGWSVEAKKQLLNSKTQLPILIDARPAPAALHLLALHHAPRHACSLARSELLFFGQHFSVPQTRTAPRRVNRRAAMRQCGRLVDIQHSED